MRPLMQAAGIALHTPTLSGLGERVHLASPQIDLETHINDILGVLHMEDLRDVTLIGFSYGGMVAAGAADRSRDRVGRLIYLDAFVPANGKSLYELMGRTVPADADWRVEPNPLPPDTSEDDVRWIRERRTPQSLACFTTPLHLISEATLPPRAYIRCTRLSPGDPLRSSAQRAKEAGWPYVEIDASHSPHITAPELLASTLLDLDQRLRD
jgi:pimeloyl-ACP methyl ester carboxylesterase